MGLRDRLRERQPVQATVAIRIDTSPEIGEYERKLDQLLVQAEMAAQRGGSDSAAALSSEMAELQEKINAAYEFVIVKALPAAEMEELIGEHPPTLNEVATGVTYNRLTFFPALLAACVDTDETAEDWAEIMVSGEMAFGEINVLINTAMELNDRSPQVNLGKGSTPTRS